MNTEKGIVFSAHMATDRENIGDVLSASAIAVLGGYKNFHFYSLPKDSGLSSAIEIIYGGGGMIRPQFAKREVYRDYRLRLPDRHYSIYGVGLNGDILGSDFIAEDFEALNVWLKNAKSVCVRDLSTKIFVEQNFDIKCGLSPCPTYGVLKDLIVENVERKYELGISVSFGHTETYKRYLNEIIFLVRCAITDFGFQNISLICHDQYDYEYAKAIFGGILHICAPRTFYQVKSEYLQCKKIISLRGHGVIFSAAMGLPCSPVLLCNKLNSLYFYHYNAHCLDLTFDFNKHVDYLNKNVSPINLTTQFYE